jgi:hypothetical protein
MLKLAICLLFFGLNAFAQNPKNFKCQVEDPIFKPDLNVQVSPEFSAQLTGKNSYQVVLASLSSMCDRPMDFAKNCVLTNNSQSNFVSFSAECYEDNNPSGRWLAKFDVSYYPSNGQGISHCSTPSGYDSYELLKCVNQ